MTVLLGIRRVAVAAALVLGTVPAGAQVGGLLGSTDGSYCKVKRGDRIEVDTWLPLDTAASFIRDMTLRRLASLSRAKGFDGFVIEREATCGILMQGQRMLSRRCRIVGQLANAPGDATPIAPDKVWLDNAGIFARTQGDAAAYPVRKGLLNRGNACVID